MIVYIARDKNGKIFAYKNKPENKEGIWLCLRGMYYIPIEETDLPEGVNPQWKDDEPIKVNLKIEKI